MKRLFSLLLALCALMLPFAGAETADEVEQAYLAACADPGVIVAFRGGCVTFEEVYAAYEEEMEFYRSLAEGLEEEFGLEPEEAIELQQQIAFELADEKLLAVYLDTNGIVLLTDEEAQQIASEIREQAEDYIAEEIEYLTWDGYSPEEAEQLIRSEFDIEGYIEECLTDERAERLVALLVGEYELIEEDLLNAYETLLSSDREYYAEYPEEFCFDTLYGDTPATYVPEGYRQVRMVVIPFDDEAMEAYDELYLQENTTGSEADALFSALLPEAEAVYARLCAGESFDAVRAEYPNTEEQMDAYGREEGFYLSAVCEAFEPDVTQAVMSLANVGDVTEPLRCDWGYMILQYAGELTPGPVPYEQVKDGLYQIADDLRYEQLFDEALERLRAEAGMEYYFERLN